MTMRNMKYADDELTLYALCKLYHRHAVVYTMTGYRYGVLTKLERTKKRLKVKEIDSLRDELKHIRENTEKAHNTRPHK